MPTVSSPASSPDPRDAHLIACYLAGDASAFDRLAAHYMPLVARFSWSLLQDADLAADAVQETFLRVIQSLGRFDTTKPFRPWLFTLARRSCQDMARRRARMLNKHQHYAEAMGASDGVAAVSQGFEDQRGVANVVEIDPSESIQARLIRREDQDLALQLMAGLDPNARQIILMRIFEDLGFAEIAEALDRPLSTVTSTYYRNIERLKQWMNEAQTPDKLHEPQAADRRQRMG